MWTARDSAWDDADENDFHNILFVPQAYSARRGTTHKTPSSPSRGLRATSGHGASRTPPPPPLNSVDDVPTDKSAFRYADVFDAGRCRVVTVMPVSFEAPGWMQGGQGIGCVTLGEWTPSPEAPPRSAVPTESAERNQTWIKICGANDGDIQAILRHFRHYGEIDGMPIPADSLRRRNWFYLKFRTKEAAAMALRSNGFMIDETRCFGVVFPTESEQEELEKRLQSSVEAPEPFPELHDASVFDPSPSSSVLPVVPPPQGAPRPELQVLSHSHADGGMFDYFKKFLCG